MTIFASLGELVLIFSLITFRWLLKQHSRKFWGTDRFIRQLADLSLAFIIITAAFGAVRFAGVKEVVGVHDMLSYWSKHIAMVVYACSLPVLFGSKSLKTPMLVIMVLALSVNILSYFASLSIPAIATDVVIFIGILAWALTSEFRMQIVVALIALLLVPATALIPASEDLIMGIFHIILAAHFWQVKRVVALSLNHSNIDSSGMWRKKFR